MGILFADLLERRFPEQFRNILTDVTFNALYLYSKIQIYFTRINKNFNNFIESNQSLAKTKRELYTFIKPINDIVIKSEKTDFIKNGDYLEMKDGNICDFAIYSWLSSDETCINKKIIYDINQDIIIPEQSNIKFMLIEIIFKEKIYKVYLKTQNYNYYFIGNKFTREFFIFYLKQYLDLNITINKNDKITLKIIDHDVNTITFDFTDNNEIIILEKNGYKVSNNDE
jgi:hypothetical protein